MTVKGGTTPACAACKYQRRKCSPSCPLAPYFPASQPKMFQNVHRLFGVSNVTKTLKDIKTKDLQDDAMRSIIYEAEIRARFPVHGCCGVMAHLRHQLNMACEELHYVCAYLDACRGQIMTKAAAGGVGGDGSGLECWMDSSNDGVYAVGHGHGHGQQALLTLEPFSDAAAAMMMGGNLGSVQAQMAQMSGNLSSVQAQMAQMSGNLSSVQAQMAQMDLVGVQERCNSIDFEGQQQLCYVGERQSYFETKDGGERQSYFETKIEADAFESSPESSLEDDCRREMKGGSVAVAENGCRRELRTAAAGFSLTTVN